MSCSSMLLSVCIGSLLLCACSKQEAPPLAATSDPAPIPAASPSAAVPTQAPAESSLALKRGKLSLAAELATFTPCGEETALWVVDQSDGVFNETFAQEPKPLDLYIEAHGERAPAPTEIAAARAYRGAFILEEVLYAAQPGESHGCSQPAPTYVVTAQGNEPFWSVEVRDDKLIWRQPDEPKELIVEALQSEDAEGAVGYSGSADGHKIELFVDQQACRDSMSGAYFAYSARASFDGKALKGCARIGD